MTNDGPFPGATDTRMIRPLQGRYVAGVCAAVGRATNTDPILWRVLAVVLTLFGGVGLLLYLIGWLVIPGEGDTASAMEALVGRGKSNTSALTVVLVSVLAVLVLVFIFSDTFRIVVFGVVAVLGAVLFFQRNSAQSPAPGVAPVPPPVGPPAPEPGYPSGSARPTPGGDPYQSVVPPVVATAPTVPSGPVPPREPMPVPAPPYPQAGFPTPPPGGYRPPFAPHGPYVNAPPPPPSAPPMSPKPPRERSRLGRIILSLMLLSLGVVVVLDLTIGLNHVAPYFAAPLAVVGAGLVVGAWLGRARWLILLGVGLTFALGLASIADSERLDEYRKGADLVWHPLSVAELNSSYHADYADAVLDLRDVDFTASKEPLSVNVDVDVGRLRVLLPPNVDVDVTASVDAGDAFVLGRRWGGFDTSGQVHGDNGADGPGGGKLVLDARIDVGNLEVGR